MKVRYEISDGVNPIRIVNPFIGTDASVTWEKEDELKFDFKKQLKEIILLKEDFRHFHNLETSENRCEVQNLSVIIGCGEDEFNLFDGHFTMSSGKWDLDRCTVKFKVSTNDPYKCIKDNDDDVNVLAIGLPNQTVNLGITVGIEIYVCAEKGSPSCDEAYLRNNKWTFLERRGFVRDVLVLAIYIRQYLISDCNYEPSSEWILNTACANNEKRYYREISLERTNLIGFDDEGKIINTYPVINQIDNGRRLRDVMQALLSASCPGLSLKSDFFQWNPDVVSEFNYVTNELNKLTNLILFQKSDVKRANVSNNATKAMWNFKEAIEQICNIFNLRYRIEGNDFRIEHLSYFEQDFGIDLMTPKNKNLLKGTRKYSYDESKLPKYENFEFMEAGSMDFVGVPIEYINNCVNNDEENRVTINVDQITTDIMYAIENPEPDGNVSDDGFVLVACDSLNNIYYEDGILEANTTINNTLSWAHLQRDYWKHGRVFMHGMMNNLSTDFLSIVPTIKQDKFTAKMGCIEVNHFDPIDQVKAALGWGFVQSAEFKLSKCVMDFELNLNDLQQGQSDGDINYGDFDEDFSEDFD